MYRFEKCCVRVRVVRYMGYNVGGRATTWCPKERTVSTPSGLYAGEGGVHVEIQALRRHGGSAGARIGTIGIFVAYQSLGVQLEGFTHHFGDADEGVSVFNMYTSNKAGRQRKKRVRTPRPPRRRACYPTVLRRWNLISSPGDRRLRH